MLGLMEENREQTIKKLREQLVASQERVQYLEKILDGAGIFYDRHCIESGEGTECTENIQEREEYQKNQGSRIIPETITKDHAKFFYSMFKGRTDVYSKRAAKPNARTGKTGYYTQCWNFWKDGLCPKKKGVQIKCADCANQRYRQLTGDDLIREKTDHIFLLHGGRGEKESALIRQQMKAVPEDETIVLVATGQYIGEGFNYPRLDTMMLTMPVAWQGNVE